MLDDIEEYLCVSGGELTSEMEMAIIARWQPKVGDEYEIVVSEPP